tara:strand:- start:33 stop:143 length:111 start_codon:yes stop_codon:yes gene_type:complete
MRYLSKLFGINMVEVKETTIHLTPHIRVVFHLWEDD